ncbi:MAG TPA: protein-L-isoaspartate(D-aspartate) O-methyltransferase [Planctomycetota bacterium]
MISSKASSDRLRDEMVDRQIRARGVKSPAVLRAMRRVRREGYVPSYLGEFAYDDTPLPIEDEQTISQPYIVAFMIEAMDLTGGERVLEIGTGSGYAAAVLAEIAGEVYTIERHARLAEAAAERLARDGYRNAHVRHGDGTLGWPEKAPFDAIVVAAGGPSVPESLRRQLAIGGRLVMPVGPALARQQLVRVTRTGEDWFEEDQLANVRFVPLVGAEGWRTPAAEKATKPQPSRAAALVASSAEPFADLERADLAPLLERVGDARVVLLGEASHGTSEFYRMRARITRELVEHKGFTIVAAEADWPDASLIDHYVRDRTVPRASWRAFSRFPTWMWRNRETAAFVDWLRQWNQRVARDGRVRFAGLDLYALHNSIDSVLGYLDKVDPEAAGVARHRYGCLTPWQRDPAAYGRAVLTGGYRSCESDVVRMLQDLLQQRLAAARTQDEQLFEAVQNARLVADAENYYRTMYYGSHESWNLRDRHMCDCLRQLLEFHGARAKIVVWAHNSHVGDARATEMAARGEWNLGQLCRQEFAAGDVFNLGFGTDHGTVAAASYWGGPMELKQVRPSLEQSYERICHDTARPSFLLPLRSPELVELLSEPRLQRAIGVIYRPETERQSHWFDAVLPEQFDEFVWFDATTAVQPLGARELDGVPDTYPFGL